MTLVGNKVLLRSRRGAFDYYSSRRQGWCYYCNSNTMSRKGWRLGRSFKHRPSYIHSVNSCSSQTSIFPWENNFFVQWEAISLERTLGVGGGRDGNIDCSFSCAIS